MKKIALGLLVLCMSTTVLAEQIYVRCEGPNRGVDTYSPRDVKSASTDRDGTIIEINDGETIKYSPSTICRIIRSK